MFISDAQLKERTVIVSLLIKFSVLFIGDAVTLLECPAMVSDTLYPQMELMSTVNMLVSISCEETS